MSASSCGRLITLEGIEGAGKSTHAKAVCAVLRDRGLDVEAVHEPGGTELGDRLRELLLSGASEIAADAELLLMFAARAELIREKMRPALEAGRWVVSDRFTDSSYAYQGGGRGCDRDWIEALERATCGGLRPDLTLLFDVAPQEGAARVEKRGDKDRFEAEGTDFFDRVRKTYLALAEAEPQRWRVISTRESIERVEAEVARELGAFLASLDRDEDE